MITDRPRLATIAIPTYSRASILKEAITSARMKDYPAIEILVVDNGSSNFTLAHFELLVGEGPRTRHVAQSHNVVPVRNFEACIEYAHAAYCMWLYHDNFTSLNYVRRCIEHLKHGGHGLAAGTSHWLSDPSVLHPEESAVAAVERRAEEEILNFCRKELSNSRIEEWPGRSESSKKSHASHIDAFRRSSRKSWCLDG